MDGGTASIRPHVQVRRRPTGNSPSHPHRAITYPYYATSEHGLLGDQVIDTIGGSKVQPQTRAPCASWWV